MEIKREYLQKYMHDVAIEQIADEYRDKGYQISKEERLGKYQADLIARKNNETIVIEVKSGKMTPQKKAAITEIGDYVKKMSNYKFFVVVANPPQKKKLEVSNLDDLLLQHMLDDIPNELDQLSTHTNIDEVSDINVDEITVQENGLIFVKGNGIVNIEMQYGSDSDLNNDLGHKTNDNFPFDFEVILKSGDDEKFKISNVVLLKVDTSSHYA